MMTQDTLQDQMFDGVSSKKNGKNGVLSRQNTDSMTAQERQRAAGDNSARTEKPKLGEIFRHARQAQGLEQRDIAARLRMSMPVIKAIESDDFASLGAPVFVRMYLQRYAQVLKLPGEDILARYKALGIDDPPPLRLAHSVRSSGKSAVRWVGYPVILAAVAWVGWVGLERMSAHFSASQSTPVVAAPDDPGPASGAPEQDMAAAVNLPAPASSETAPAARGEDIMGLAPLPVAAAANTESAADSASEIMMLTFDPKAPVVPSDSMAETNHLDEAVGSNNGVLSRQNTDDGVLSRQNLVPATDNFVQAAANAAQASAKSALDSASNNAEKFNESESLSAAVSTQTSRLVIKVDKDCWVEIKDDNGQRLAYGTMKANTERSWAGKAPFSVTLGNAYAARLELDGTVIKRSVYLPKSGTVSRFVLRPDQSG